MTTATFSNKTGLDLTVVVGGADGDVTDKTFNILCGKSVTINIPDDMSSYSGYTTVQVQSTNYSATATKYNIGHADAAAFTLPGNSGNSLFVLGVKNNKAAGYAAGTATYPISKTSKLSKNVLFLTCVSGKIISDEKSTKYMITNSNAANKAVIGFDPEGTIDVSKSLASRAGAVSTFVAGLATGDTTMCDIPYFDNLVGCDSTIGGWSITLMVILILLIVIAIVIIIIMGMKLHKRN